MDREMQNKLAERANERREETARAWLQSPQFRALMLRYRQELLGDDKRHQTLVAAE
jgi:hypothetical protein